MLLSAAGQGRELYMGGAVAGIYGPSEVSSPMDTGDRSLHGGGVSLLASIASLFAPYLRHPVDADVGICNLS